MIQLLYPNVLLFVESVIMCLGGMSLNFKGVFSSKMRIYDPNHTFDGVMQKKIRFERIQNKKYHSRKKSN